MWADNLQRKAAHKALDIEDDMSVTSIRGVGGATLLGVAAVSTLGPLAIAAYLLWQNAQQETHEPAPPPAVQQPGPIDSEYEVRFFDADGNPINVPHISQRPE